MTRLGRPFGVLAVTLAALAAPPSLGRAQPLPYGSYERDRANGFSAVDTSRSEVEALDGGRELLHVESSGLFYTEDPDSPLNESSYRCFGTHLLDAGGASEQGHGYCAGVAKGGDLWWVDWQGDLESGSWRFAGGTGALAGIEGSGRWANEAALSPDETVITWTGSWRLPVSQHR